MKTIYTSKMQEIFVDDEDYEFLNKYHWNISKNGYAAGHVGENKNKKYLYMHRVIMGVTAYSELVDHINHNKIDNQKQNLRVCDKSKNGMNQKLSAKNTSSVTGVHWDKTNLKWRAQIMIHQKTIPLGRFVNFDDAVNARKEAEEEYFGEFRYKEVI